MINKHLATGIVMLAWFIGANGLVYGQKSTELYTPIGKSPGLSGKLTIIGTIESVDEENRSVTIVDPSGSRSANITEDTKIYLDKSKIGRTNAYGSFSDLERGVRVEILYVARERGADGPAEWVKVEVTENSPQ